MNFKFFQEGLKTNVIKISIKILVDKIEFLIYFILKMWVLRAQDIHGDVVSLAFAKSDSIEPAF